MVQAAKRKWSGNLESADRADFFGPPPLIQGEDQVAYEDLLAKVYSVVKPQDIIEEMYVRDVADLSWEIWRWRRQKAALISGSLGEGINAVLASTTSVLAADTLQNDSLRVGWVTGDPQAKKRVSEILRSAELTVDSIPAQALAAQIEVIERIDRMTMNAEIRRNAAFREIERHRGGLGRILRSATKEIDGAEYQDVTRGQAAE